MILVIGHLKGGTGKSTLTVNLAEELHRRDFKVVIVEADPTVRTSTNWGEDRLKDNSLAPITVMIKYGDVSQAVAELDGTYDFVLIDAAGKDSPELRTGMAAADALIVPQPPSNADLDTLDALDQIVKKVRRVNPDLAATIVLSRADTHPMIDDVSQTRAVLNDYPGFAVASTVIHERRAYRTALAAGRGVVQWKDYKAKAEIQVLVTELIGD